MISGDHILYILYVYLLERGKLVTNTVVTTIMSNFGLYKALDELGIDYAKTKVGDKYVYEYMQQSGARIGGEQSGHIIFSKYASTGDGILTSLKMMEVMLAGRSPSVSWRRLSRFIPRCWKTSASPTRRPPRRTRTSRPRWPR